MDLVGNRPSRFSIPEMSFRDAGEPNINMRVSLYACRADAKAAAAATGGKVMGR
jgi:hypothetical protein